MLVASRASYVVFVLWEESSTGHRRLSHVSKQGNSLVRFSLVEAAQATVRSDPDWRRKVLHLAMRRDQETAEVAMANVRAVSSKAKNVQCNGRTLLMK